MAKYQTPLENALPRGRRLSLCPHSPGTPSRAAHVADRCEKEGVINRNPARTPIPPTAAASRPAVRAPFGVMRYAGGPPPGLEAMSKCCEGHTITIGLTDYSYPPLYTFDADTRTYSGFLPNLIMEMSDVMWFKYNFRGGSLVGARPRTGPGGRAWTHRAASSRSAARAAAPLSARSAARDAPPPSQSCSGASSAPIAWKSCPS